MQTVQYRFIGTNSTVQSYWIKTVQYRVIGKTVQNRVIGTHNTVQVYWIPTEHNRVIGYQQYSTGLLVLQNWKTKKLSL